MQTNTREHWDAAAQDFQRSFALGLNDYNRKLFRFWQDGGMVRPGDRVLDVGCGVGRYGLLLAALGCDVMLTDISPRMLALAEENLAAYPGRFRTFACDFHRVTGEEEAFAGGFDFSISTLSPAICDAAGVETLSRMTRGVCFLTRFHSWHEPDRDALLRALSLSPQPRSIAMRADCDALLQAVAETGRKAVFRLEDYNWQDTRTPEEQAAYMRRGYAQALSGVGEDALLSAVESLCGPDGLFCDRVFTRVAWICWHSEGTP